MSNERVTVPQIRDALGVDPDKLRRVARDVARRAKKQGVPLAGEQLHWVALSEIAGKDALRQAVKGEESSRDQ